MTVTYALTASLLFLGLTLMLFDVGHKLRKSKDRRISLILIGATMFYVAMDCLWIVVYTGETFHRSLFILLNFLFYLVYITLPYIWFLFAKHFSGSGIHGIFCGRSAILPAGTSEALCSAFFQTLISFTILFLSLPLRCC